MLRFARFTAVALTALTPAALIAAPVPKVAKRMVGVAYIHAADEKTAGAFKTMLDDEGFRVELLADDAVAKADLSTYGLLVVGNDTENSKWGDSAAAVEKSGKPVLGLGEGGYTAFGKDGLKLAIDAPHGWHGSDAAVLPVDAAKSPLWTAAGMPDGKAVTVYGATGHVGICLPNPPADVGLLGREEVSLKHYALVRQGDRFVLWGFTAGPDAMTADGRKLFVATCRYTAGLANDKSRDPLRGRACQRPALVRSTCAGRRKSRPGRRSRTTGEAVRQSEQDVPDGTVLTLPHDPSATLRAAFSGACPHGRHSSNALQLNRYAPPLFVPSPSTPLLSM